MGNEKYLFRSNGQYLGFISSDNIYSRDGIFLGWMEGNIAWDFQGKFRGILFPRNNFNYIIRDRLTIPPVSRTPKTAPNLSTLPQPQANISPTTLPVGFEDSF
jgi:hypothetical protein